MLSAADELALARWNSASSPSTLVHNSKPASKSEQGDSANRKLRRGRIDRAASVDTTYNESEKRAFEMWGV